MVSLLSKKWTILSSSFTIFLVSVEDHSKPLIKQRGNLSTLNVLHVLSKKLKAGIKLSHAFSKSGSVEKAVSVFLIIRGSKLFQTKC